MNRKSLIKMLSELARLLHDRSSTPRRAALAEAHARLRTFALKNNYPLEWCDRVMLMFLYEKHDIPIVR